MFFGTFILQIRVQKNNLHRICSIKHEWCQRRNKDANLGRLSIYDTSKIRSDSLQWISQHTCRLRLCLDCNHKSIEEMGPIAHY